MSGDFRTGCLCCPLLQSVSWSWVGLGAMLSDLPFILVQNSEPSQETLLLISTSFLASTQASPWGPRTPFSNTPKVSWFSMPQRYGMDSQIYH